MLLVTRDLATLAIVVLIAVSDPQAAWVEALVGVTVAITIVSGLAYAIAYYGGRREPVATVSGAG